MGEQLHRPSELHPFLYISDSCSKFPNVAVRCPTLFIKYSPNFAVYYWHLRYCHFSPSYLLHCSQGSPQVPWRIIRLPWECGSFHSFRDIDLASLNFTRLSYPSMSAFIQFVERDSYNDTHSSFYSILPPSSKFVFELILTWYSYYCSNQRCPCHRFVIKLTPLERNRPTLSRLDHGHVIYRTRSVDLQDLVGYRPTM